VTEVEWTVDAEDSPDDAVVDATTDSAHVTIDLSIAYSATYQVPVLYFRGSDAGVSALSHSAGS
jgi:hypothetical protein